MHGKNAMDKKRYRIYRDEVLLSFVMQTRLKFGKQQVENPIFEELKVASWCDGDLV